MLSDPKLESPYTDPWGYEFDRDPRCEFCDRSVIARFGGQPGAECEACAAEFRHLAAHGLLIEEAA